MTCYNSIAVLNLWRYDAVLFAQNVYQDILGSIVAENVADIV